MTKFRKSLLILVFLTLIICAALGTFVVLSLTGSLKDEPIALEFTVGDLFREYNGKPQKASVTDNDCYELVTMNKGYLIEGHTLDVSFTGEQTEVGRCSIGLEVKVLREDDGYDVTGQYRIKVNKGNLFVSKKTVNIKLTASDVTYDGNMIDIGDKYTATGLVSGHRVSLKLSDDWYNGSDKIIAGRPIDPRYVEYIILDGNGSDVTENYALESFSGSINILQRPLTISPVSAEKTYDGKPLTCSDYKIESGSLASGHYVAGCTFESADGEKSLTNAGSIDIGLSGAVIRDIDGNDVTANYLIGTGSATLTVNKAPLTITAKSESWVYDGTEHSLINDDKPYSVIGLVDGDEVTVEYYGSVTDVSADVNRIVNYLINNGVDSNYTATFIDGKLEVTKAPLTVKLYSIEKEYGDEYEVSLEDLYEINSSIDNLRLSADEAYIKNLLKNAVIGVSTYTLNNFAIVNDLNEDITDKCNITVIPGNLSVLKRDVLLASVITLTKEYDGNLIFNDVTENIFTANALVNNDRVESVTVNEDGGILSVVIIDERGNNITANYNIINLSECTVDKTITPRLLKISTQTLTKVYDGQPLYGGEIKLETALASGDVLVTAKQISATDVSDNGVINVPEFEILNSKGEDVKNNYSLEENYGTITVTPANLTIVGRSESFVYDGNSHSSEGPDLVLGLAACDKVTLTYSTSVTDVSVEDNRFEYSIKGIDTEESREFNYIVDYVYGKIQITKAPLTVTLKTLEKQYGDTFNTDNLYTVLSSVENLELNVNDDIDELLKGVAIGSSTYSINDFTVLCDDKDVTENFAVNVVAGNVTIKPREVSLVSGITLTKEYDGNLIFRDITENIFTANALVNNDRVESVTINKNGEILSVIIIDELRNITTANYNITNLTNCTIEKKFINRSLKISTQTLTKVYDGQPLYGGDIILESPLATGDVLVTTKQISITDVSIDNYKIVGVTNEPEFVILNSKGDNVTNNYSLEKNYGTLTITQKALTVSLNPIYYPSSEAGDLKNYLSSIDLSSFVVVSGFVNNEVFEYDYDIDIDSYSFSNNTITVDVSLYFFTNNGNINYVCSYDDIESALIPV